MPKTDNIINLPGFAIKKVCGINPIIYEVNYKKKVFCPYCNGKKLRYKDRFIRDINHETVGMRRTVLRVEVKKYQCCNCKKYFRQSLEGILKWQRSTEPFKKQVYLLHVSNVSRKDLGLQLNKSDGTINNYYNHVYELENKKRLSMKCPKILGIDEHSFNKKQGYATTFCDLQKQRIFDVVKGKSAKDLEEYLNNLTDRDRVKVVCMDMSESYRSIVRKYFPNAKIVTDRFHVVKLALHHLTQNCVFIDPSLKEKRGITKLLRKHRSNLTPTQLAKLDQYLKQNPAIDAIYQFKEKLMILLLAKKQTKEQCKKLIPQFLNAITQLKSVSFEHCRKLAKSMEKWQEEIVRMWRFTKSNGTTEGFHRKMKLIQRLAFGFKNFENYRMRVRLLCL
jgi:transposase